MIRIGHFPGCPRSEACTCPPAAARGRRTASPEWVIAWHVHEARKSAGLGLTGRLRAAARRLAS